jgi:hypothetical protein
VSPLSPYKERVLDRFNRDGKKVPMTEPAQPATSAFPVVPNAKAVADRVGWGRTIIGGLFALLVAVAMGVIFVTTLASHDEVQAAVQEHSQTDGHPSLSTPLRDLGNRMIRIETLQQQAATLQNKMDDKLDRLLSAGAAWRGPLNTTQPVP